MRGLLGVMARLIRRFGAARSGAAAVEFALILPVMLLVYIGGTEASALIILDRKVQTVAGALGDLVARADGTISTTSMKDYFRAATAILNPYPIAGLEQIVTGVNVSKGGTATVAWSRKYVNGDYENGPYTRGNSFTLPEAMVDISKDGFVVVSEASATYLPLYGIVFDQPINLHRENYYLPRFDEAISEPK